MMIFGESKDSLVKAQKIKRAHHRSAKVIFTILISYWNDAIEDFKRDRSDRILIFLQISNERIIDEKCVFIVGENKHFLEHLKKLETRRGIATWKFYFFFFFFSKT